MATRRSVRASRPSGTLRRKRIWARDEIVLTPSATGAAVELGADFATELGTTHLPLGATVAGIRLELTVSQTSARATALDGFMLGIIAVDETVAGEVEAPLSDPHADWMYRLWVPAPGAAAGATRSNWERGEGVVMVRAKRKVEELGTRLWVTGQLSGLTTYEAVLYVSTLVLLP